MARRGQVRYKVAAGRPLYGGTHNNSTVSPDFLLGRPPGAFNNTSLYGGLIASTGDYRSAALGIGQNMGLLGALSADVTRSDARLPHGQKQSGYSYRINYAKTFDKTGSTGVRRIPLLGPPFSVHAGVPAASGHRRRRCMA